MRQLMVVAVLVAAVLLMPGRSKADGMDTIVATATYSRNTKNTGFSAPGTPISFAFTLPASLDGSETAFSVPVSVTLKGATTSQIADVAFYDAGEGGLFDLYLTSGGHTYEWDFAGPQIFNAENVLVPGTTGINPSASDFLKDFGPSSSGYFTSGSVVVSNVTSSVPEPTSLLLLGIGLFGVVPAWRKRALKQ